jgi:hypothetical protein
MLGLVLFVLIGGIGLGGWYSRETWVEGEGICWDIVTM